MLDFLKKKKQTDSDNSLDDLPPAPKPNSSPNITPAQNQSNEPYIPPIPESDAPAPPPPSSQSTVQDLQASVPEIKEPMSEIPPSNPLIEEKSSPAPLTEEQEPLPNAPNIPEELTSEEPKEELEEPAPLNEDSSKPISPKDIDPRDRFDDIIKMEQTPELPAPAHAEPAPEEEISQPASFNPPNGEISEPEDKPINFEPQTEIPIQEETEEELSLPSADELAAKLSPVLAKTSEPRSDSQSLPEMPADTTKLPSFGTTPLSTMNEPAIHTAATDPEFALPDMKLGPAPEKELALFVTVNDYALVTQSMKKLLRFFKKSTDTLGLADKPEKVQVMNELYKELNSAQQSLMDIDKKLFERDSPWN